MRNPGGSSNERRFRRGAWLLLLLAGMSAASTSALYWGIRLPIFYATSLALPVVSDIALQTFFSGWIWMEKVRYYWFLGSSVLAGVLALVALLALTTSFAGRAFHQSFPGRGIGKLFAGLGLAQLLSARALSAFGLLFYGLDLALSAGLVFAFPQTFTPLYLFLLVNLLIHLFSLSFLGYAFTAGVGGGRESDNAIASVHGDLPDA
jgi:hypothetical protein